MDAVVQQIRHLAESGRASPLTDQQLLERFIARRDESAFAALVRRHGPMILGLCRRLLHQVQDAEDVVQATFMVLARKAAVIRKQESVGSWLYGVAYRLALKARTDAMKRRNQQMSRVDKKEADPLSEITWREVCTALDEELARLPDRCRAPLVLCYLQGKTQDEALQQLGWSKSTFRRRLEDGRAKLCLRLTRRGITLSAGLWATLLSDQGASAALSSALLQTTVKAAIPFAAGEVAAAVSPHVILLAKHALKAAVLHKMKWIALLGIVTAFTTGIGLAAHQALTANPANDEQKELLARADERRDQPKPETPNQPRLDRYGDPLPEGAIARLGTVRFRAPAEIGSVAFSPDGKTVAVYTQAGLFLFDSTSGKRLVRLAGSDAAWHLENAIVFSPDGKRLASRGVASVGDQGKWVVRVWELAGERKSKDYHADHIMWLGWSPDDEPLAVCLEQAGLRLHELASGRSRRFECESLPKPELSETIVCACAPAGKTLAIADWEKNIHVWDTATGLKRWTVQPKNAFARCLALSPDGTTLASLNRDQNSPDSEVVQLWDASTGKPLRSVATDHKNIYTLTFAPNGKMLATAGFAGVRFWDVATGREGSRSQGDGSDTERIAFSGDGRSLVTAQRHSPAFHLWDVATGKRKPEPVGHTCRAGGTAFSPDGRRLATAGGLDGTIHFWDLATGKSNLRIHRPGQWVRDIALSANGRSLFSTWTDENLWVCDTATGERQHIIKLEDPDRPESYQSAISMHMSDDGKTLIAISYYYPKKNGAGPSHQETLITGWDASTRKQLFRRRLPGMDSWIALSPDARVLALPYPPVDLKAHELAMVTGGSVKRTIRLEDLATGEPLVTLPNIEGQTSPLAFAPDGRLLAMNNFNSKGIIQGDPSSTGSTLRLREVASGTEVLSLPVDGQHRAAFSRDGKLLAVAAPLEEIVVWDLTSSTELQRFKGFDAEVTSLVFSPDGRQLISGLGDSTLLIWDLRQRAIPQSAELRATVVAKAWADLAGNDASRAFRARWTLASVPGEAVSLLKEHLHPTQAADPERLKKLIADLDSKQFAERDQAQKELETLGESAAPALRRTLADKPSLEVSRRIQSLLDKLHEPVTQPEQLRGLRALAVLEEIGTPEAQEILKILATGAAEARLTQEAKASLDRLAHRSAVAP
jgi:RNA polymerase sigma factor (sigma-70 family)